MVFVKVPQQQPSYAYGYGYSYGYGSSYGSSYGYPYGGNKPLLYPQNPSLEEELKRLFAEFAFQQANELRYKCEVIREDFKHNGFDSEYCPELEEGSVQPYPKKSRKNKKQILMECVFCKNNGEDPNFYSQHYLKDQDGRVVCPILRNYTCPICRKNGDEAHTLKYCPMNKFGEVVSPVHALKESRNSTGKRRSR